MRRTGWSGKGGGRVVKVKKKRTPEEPLQVLWGESSDDRGSVRSVVLAFKVLAKIKDHIQMV